MTAPQLVSPDSLRAVERWLIFCLFFVALMVLVGGLTRLTESGLSIVEWKPISGIVPPYNEGVWNEYYREYQESPQYQKINKGMSLEEFKGIFWLEFIHRLIGRLAGAVFFLPLLYFAARKAIRLKLGIRLFAIFALGGLQGLVGWIMVASGLVDQPMVSPIKLGVHLLLAFALFGLLLWTWLEIRQTSRIVTAGWLRYGANLLLAIIITQVFLGALVAGNDAGLTYNTFPLMDGRWIPEGLWLLDPWWKNLFHSVTTVQFMHRLGAWILASYTLVYALTGWRYLRHAEPEFAEKLLGLIWIMVLQFGLGILTLTQVVTTPLASMHQMTALLLFSYALMLRFYLGKAH